MPPESALGPRPASWLVSQLAAAKVVEETQLRSYLPRSLTRGSAYALAEHLVQAGVLTRFQAERSLAGEAGKLALGPYLLTDPIGSGSLGTVYRAIGRNDRKWYAVKVLPLRSLWNVHLAKKQVTEFAGLPPHPAIVPFVDIDSAGGSHYLVWPFVQGRTLEEWVHLDGALAVPQAVTMMRELADGLAACHAHGIAHGLLKPSNVFLDPTGRPRILDLGIGAILAENLAEDESLLDTISTANAAMGMIDCAAPETLADPAVRTPAADVYSFGCVLYYVLTGSLPFPDGNAVDRVIAHQAQPPTRPRRRTPAVPDWLDDLVMKLLAKRPEWRPATLADVRDALAAGGRSRPAAEVPTPTDVHTPRLPAPVPRPSEPTPMPPLSADDSVTFDPTTDPLFDLSDEFSVGPPATSPEIEPPILLQPRPPRPPAPPPAAPAVEPPVVLKPRPARPADPQPTPSPSRPADLPVPLSFQPAADAPPPRPAGGWFSKLVAKARDWLSAADPVRVSVFGPADISPGQTVRYQVYVHPPEAADSVRTLARSVHGGGELLAAGDADRLIARGARVGVHLAVSNAGVADPLAEFDWLGPPKPLPFDVHVPWEAPPGTVAAAVSVGADGALAGCVRFAVRVRPRRG